jgi:hypothetical protein
MADFQETEWLARTADVQVRVNNRQDIEPRRVHRVVNATPRPLRYLLVQATGPYDFNAVT